VWACWCGGPQPPTTLPAVLARPWATVAAALDMPPVLVYATYNLMNHRRLDATGGVELGNLAVQHVSCVCVGMLVGGWFLGSPERAECACCVPPAATFICPHPAAPHPAAVPAAIPGRRR
jgi:hypothetical protein